MVCCKSAQRPQRRFARAACGLLCGLLFSLDGVPADLQGVHVLFDGVGRHAVGDGGLDGVEGDEAREVDERAKGDDVREERAADFLDGELRDGYAHDVREVRHLGHELLVEDEEA